MRSWFSRFLKHERKCTTDYLASVIPRGGNLYSLQATRERASHAFIWEDTILPVWGKGRVLVWVSQREDYKNTLAPDQTVNPKRNAAQTSKERRDGETSWKERLGCGRFPYTLTEQRQRMAHSEVSTQWEKKKKKEKKAECGWIPRAMKLQ